MLKRSFGSSLIIGIGAIFLSVAAGAAPSLHNQPTRSSVGEQVTVSLDLDPDTQTTGGVTAIIINIGWDASHFQLDDMTLNDSAGDIVVGNSGDDSAGLSVVTVSPITSPVHLGTLTFTSFDAGEVQINQQHYTSISFNDINILVPEPLLIANNDHDQDGIDDLSDPCVTLEWSNPPLNPADQNPVKAKLSLRYLDGPAGIQRLEAKGRFNPAPSSLTADPSSNGVHVQLRDSGGLLYDVDIPGGDLGTSACGDSDGWRTRVSGKRTYWYYRNRSGAVPPECTPGSAGGISAIVIKDLSNTNKSTFTYDLRARDMELLSDPESPITDLRFNLALAKRDADGSTSLEARNGQCLELAFTGSPVASTSPRPFCKISPGVSMPRHISCRGQ